MRALRRGSYKEVPGRHYDTPKELWGFRSRPGTGAAARIARSFLEANAKTLGVDAAELFREEPRLVSSLGAEHVILQQHWKRRRVHRAYVTVHVGEDRRVYLVKTRAAPQDVLDKAQEPIVSRDLAVRRARGAVRGSGGKHVVGAPELMWYPDKALLRPAWRVRVHREKSRAEFLVYVNARNGAILDKYDNLSHRTGLAWVFRPNPMASSRRFVPLDEDDAPRRPDRDAYVEVKLRGLSGNGRLDGPRATTRITSKRLRKPNLDFRMEAHQNGFEEVSAYHHVDSAIAYLEDLGYRGRHRIFDRPLPIAARGTREDNSWYSPGRRTLTFGTGEVDDAEDGETVLHEFGHALQDAICPDFGQSVEAAAMGEGFGDYWAGSFFEKHKPSRYRLTVMSWDGAGWDGDPPGVRRLDSARTFETFDHSDSASEHDNGEIWSATLWEVRDILGAREADRVIVESHFQLDGFTTLARGARAILDANRNLRRGRNAEALRDVFRRRGIGPVE